MTLAIVLLAVTVLSVAAAQKMASGRCRSARTWMIAAVLLGPLPLIALALLRNRAMPR
jgi:hypothetical protein